MSILGIISALAGAVILLAIACQKKKRTAPRAHGASWHKGSGMTQSFTAPSISKAHLIITGAKVDLVDRLLNTDIGKNQNVLVCGHSGKSYKRYFKNPDDKLMRDLKSLLSSQRKHDMGYKKPQPAPKPEKKLTAQEILYDNRNVSLDHEFQRGRRFCWDTNRNHELYAEWYNPQKDRLPCSVDEHPAMIRFSWFIASKKFTEINHEFLTAKIRKFLKYICHSKISNYEKQYQIERLYAYLNMNTTIIEHDSIGEYFEKLLKNDNL